MKTITIKGVGSASARPDCITILLNLEAKSKSYDEAMNSSAEKIIKLQDAITSLGFKKEDLKTTSFNVRTEYENQRDENGSYHSIFAGYVCAYSLKLSFDFDNKRLAEVLRAITESKVSPELSIAFTLKDATAINEALLESATQNARRKAEILAKASGATLGELVSIDYNWGELSVISPTRYSLSNDCMPLMASYKAAPEIEPEDISIKDSVTFVWALC